MHSDDLSFTPSPAQSWHHNQRRLRSLQPHNTATCTLIRAEAQMKPIRGVSEIVSRYDCVLLDQFGVIHDGQTPYPRALEAIRKLHDHAIKIVILSNSSRQAKHAAEKLTRMGIDTETIHGIVTSGQLAYGAIREEMTRRPESRVLHFNWNSGRGTISTEDHNIRQIPPLKGTIGGMRVPSPEDVDMIVAHGTDGIMTSPTEIQTMPIKALRDFCKQIAQQRPDLPFYCANPDMVTVDGSKLRVMPGTLAKDFEDAGGTCVRRMGKPDSVAYNAAVELLDAANKGRVLAIGDSLGHDILGAVNAGIDSLYVLASMRYICIFACCT